MPNAFILASTYMSLCALHQLLWYLQRAHLRSWLLEWLPVGFSCQHPMMCPVEGVGTFLGDASTCPGCACFPSSQQSSRAHQRALRHLLWSLLHKRWGLVSKTFNGPSSTVPSTLPRTSPSIRIHEGHLTHRNWDFAHSRVLQDPLPSPLGLCPIKSPGPSCSKPQIQSLVFSRYYNTKVSLGM